MSDKDTLTDKSIMPFGKHKGTEMANVPAEYLLWLYAEYTEPNPIFGFINQQVKAYIEDNLDILKSEL